MSNPTLPPYLGSWQELVNALLHNPFLGSGHGGTPHRTHNYPEARLLESDGPQPSPWYEAIMGIVGLVCLKQSVSKMAAGPEKTALVQGINSSIIAAIDDCGTPYGHWHWPGPPPLVLGIASALVFVANTFQEESARVELADISAKILQRASAGGKLGEQEQEQEHQIGSSRSSRNRVLS